LLRILNKKKIKQFIHISSVAVYGIEHNRDFESYFLGELVFCFKA
jgi:thioester reductase-like protein